jgi:hypothetical protein
VGKGGGAVATAAILNRHAEVGDDRRGGTMRQARVERDGEREGGVPTNRRATVARDHRAAWHGHAARPAEQGMGKGLTSGPQSQCRATTPADRQVWCTVPGRRFKRDLNNILNSKVSNKFKLFLNLVDYKSTFLDAEKLK